MQTVGTVAALRRIVGEWRRNGSTIALVPTMGNLHAGHMRLMEGAKQQADRVVVSVFVNPTQFVAGEDFDAYPRTPEQDQRKLREAGVDLLFLPEVAELYPADPATMTFLEVPELSGDLCGRFRPGHFRGVLTVVCKLFNQVQPDVALFGEKDYQQLTVIRRMVADLDLPLRIVGVPTVREPNGLALSSRNAYLTAAETENAALLYASLREAAEAVRRGRNDFDQIEAEGLSRLRLGGFRPDYFAVRCRDHLATPKPSASDLMILAAAWLGRARLIDNIAVDR
jgi:pantoate--beta-alanine ligase